MRSISSDLEMVQHLVRGFHLWQADCAFSDGEARACCMVKQGLRQDKESATNNIDTLGTLEAILL